VVGQGGTLDLPDRRRREPSALLDNAIQRCTDDEVPEIRTLAQTLSRWRTEILNHRRTGRPTGPTEGMNFCAKHVERSSGASPTSSTTVSESFSMPEGVTWTRPGRPNASRESSPQSAKGLSPGSAATARGRAAPYTVTMVCRIHHCISGGQ
jgi:hypothetical protein